MISNKKSQRRDKIRTKIRGKISGTAQKPRLSVFRSNKAIYAQLVDDLKGITICAASTTDKALAAEGSKSDMAKKVGALLATRAAEKGIADVVFDRSGYLYHGRIKALAEGAREGGLKF